MASKATKKVSSTVKKTTVAHPPYAEMIKEAITFLKERTGSSQIAIAKFIDDKHSKTLPPNYKKLILVQLKRLVASGSLTKVKSSFKLAKKPETTKPVKKVTAGATKPKKVTDKKVMAKKVTTPVKAKKVAVKDKKATPKKVTAGGKKTTLKKVAKKGTPTVMKAKKVVMKAKGVKSIKSPVKKVLKKVVMKAKGVKSIKSPVKKVLKKAKK